MSEIRGHENDLTLSEQLARLHDRVTDLSEDGEIPAAPTEELLAELASAHEELMVADEEVRAQLEELDRLIAARGEARRIQERFLAFLPTAVVATNASGSITFANPAAAALLGVGLDQLVGKPILAFVEPDDRPAVRNMLTSMTTGASVSARRLATLRTRLGDTVSVEIGATVERDGQRSHPVATWALVTTMSSTVAVGDVQGGSLADALLGMAQLPIATTDTMELLSAMATLCSRAYDIEVTASVTVGAPSAPDFVATESAVAQRIDGAQLMSGEGPCQEAWESNTTVRAMDLQNDRRWPTFTARIQGETVRAAVAVPLRTPASSGCLNLYSEDQRLAEKEQMRTAEMLGAAISSVLYETDLKNELSELAGQLRTALTSRAVIDQAKGIVMSRQRCSADDAFKLLVRLSSARNVKLRDLAVRLVNEVSEG